MQKDISTEKGINEQKNQKNLKKFCIFPPFLAKRVGLFDWKKCKITAKNMPSKTRQNKKTFTKGGFAE